MACGRDSDHGVASWSLMYLSLMYLSPFILLFFHSVFGPVYHSKL